MGASNGNSSPLVRPGEQARARAGTARASTQSLAELYAGSIVGEILYARLFSGLRFFDKNHYRLYLVCPACAPESACADPRTNSANAYPQLNDALKLLSAKSAIIDGEITVLDADERTSFQLIQFYGSDKRTQFLYHAFDVVFIAN
jgi:hypothetical protein